MKENEEEKKDIIISNKNEESEYQTSIKHIQEQLNNASTPFKNLMNDEYARDISNKVRSVLDNKKNNGQFIGSVAPFGYKKDPNNKHKFIIDELNKMQILPPALYKIDEGLYNYDIKETAKKWDTKK